jgi:hypothetical protein
MIKFIILFILVTSCLAFELTYYKQPKFVLIFIVVTYKIRIFFEGAQKEVFTSILKFENVNT